MELKPTKTFNDGELLPGGIWVIHLQDQKSPGESALFLQQGKGVLIVGDALIGKPPGGLSLLPAEKYADAAKAKAGLRRLLKYQFDAVLMGRRFSPAGRRPLNRPLLRHLRRGTTGDHDTEEWTVGRPEPAG
jgi:glyoxylase-like metal-dependent hydrolase (beta-lactamase superfamily II)